MADNISTGILSGLYEKVYNPDVLSCLANLSSDEVFTPPEIVNKMLDMLPQELFSSPDTKFLDPAVKTGVYLREIAKRLIKGLEAVIPDRQQRIDHIFKNQLYGISLVLSLPCGRGNPRTFIQIIVVATRHTDRQGQQCRQHPSKQILHV